MAGNEDCSESSVCKYCSKKVAAGGNKCVSCVECSSVFHSSCSQRIKGAKIIDSQKNLILCCSDGNKSASESANSMKDENIIDCCNSIEVKYLRHLLTEKDARIRDLMKINSLLEQKIILIETAQRATDKQLIGKQKSKNDSEFTSETVQIKKVVESDKNISKKDDNLKKYVNKQKSKMNEIIYLAGNTTTDKNQEPNLQRAFTGDGQTNEKSSKGNEWKEVTYKKKPRRDVGVFGTGGADPNGKITAIKKRAWIYVGKIANPEVVTNEDVLNYLKRLGSEDCTCERIDSKGAHAAFKVSVPFDLKDKALDPSFWPANVNIRRYNFYRKTHVSKEENTFLEQLPL